MVTFGFQTLRARLGANRIERSSIAARTIPLAAFCSH